MNFDKVDLCLNEEESGLCGLLLGAMMSTIKECDQALREKNSLTIGECNRLEDHLTDCLKKFVKIIERR